MLAGDRIVVETGTRRSVAEVAAGLVVEGMFMAWSAKPDLPEDETTTGFYNTWVEFSQDIPAFQPSPPSKLRPYTQEYIEESRAYWGDGPRRETA